MKWMIALTLAGSAAIVPATANTSEGMGVESPAITQEIESNGYFPGEVISDAAINPTILLDEWDTLSPEQQAEWQSAHDKLVKQAKIAHDKAVREERIKRLDDAIKAVVNQVGKTPYVLSGSTLSGWDCSGLVKWMYSKLGIDVPHSAGSQRYVGPQVTDPRPGDIVVWGDGYHSGIYIGNGKAVHAYNPNRDTIITKVSSVPGTATFTRVYDY
jgi:cell wall-associated NlpC family hydrolase